MTPCSSRLRRCEGRRLLQTRAVCRGKSTSRRSAQQLLVAAGAVCARAGPVSIVDRDRYVCDIDPCISYASLRTFGHDRPRAGTPTISNHLKPSQTISNISNYLKLSQTISNCPTDFERPPCLCDAISNCLGQTSAPPSSISKSPRSARPLCARDPLSQIDLTLYLKSTGPSQIQPAPPLSTYHHLKN